MKNEKGFSLIEVLVASALLGIVGVGILASLGTVTKILIVADQHESAMNLARAQMEYIINEPFSTNSPPVYGDTPLVADYPGLTMDTDVTYINDRDSNIHMVTITVTRDSDGETIFVLQDYKVR